VGSRCRWPAFRRTSHRGLFLFSCQIPRGDYVDKGPSRGVILGEGLRVVLLGVQHNVKSHIVEEFEGVMGITALNAASNCIGLGLPLSRMSCRSSPVEIHPIVDETGRVFPDDDRDLAHFLATSYTVWIASSEDFLA